MRNAIILSLLFPLLLVAQPPPKQPGDFPAAGEDKAPSAKSFGNLRVSVEDAKGAPIAEAWVAIEKLKRSYPTGETGQVAMAWVPVGAHLVKVAKEGFKTALAQALVEEEKTTVLKVKLEAEAK